MYRKKDHSALTLRAPLPGDADRLVTSDLSCASCRVAIVKHLDQLAELRVHRKRPALGHRLAGLEVQEPFGDASQGARPVVPTTADDQNVGVYLEEFLDRGGVVEQRGELAVAPLVVSRGVLEADDGVLDLGCVVSKGRDAICALELVDVKLASSPLDDPAALGCVLARS